MLKKVFLLLFLFSYIVLWSQTSLDAKVYLKSGSILYARLVAYDPKGDIIIELNGTNITLPAAEVKKIVMLNTDSKEDEEPFHFSKNFYNNTRVSMMKGQSGTGFSLSHTFYKQIMPNLLVGLGGGIENYYIDSDRNIVPLFADAKYYFLNKKTSPFITLRLGYGIAAFGNSSSQLASEGGIHINPTLGYRLFGNDFYSEIYMGIKRQKMYYETYDGWSTDKRDIFANRLELGISFIY